MSEEAFASNRCVLDRFFSESPLWILDPVDETRAFVRGIPCFGVIVAVAERNQTLAAWLYDPTSKSLLGLKQALVIAINSQLLSARL